MKKHIALAGPLQSGKNQLLNRLLNDNFDDRYEETIGVDFVLNQDYTFWSLGGEFSTSLMLLRNPSFWEFWLTVSINDKQSLETLLHVMRHIVQYHEAPRIRLIITKADLYEGAEPGYTIEPPDIGRFFEKANQEGFTLLPEVIVTSAITGEGIDELKQALNEGLATSLPAKYKKQWQEVQEGEDEEVQNLANIRALLAVYLTDKTESGFFSRFFHAPPNHKEVQEIMKGAFESPHSLLAELESIASQDTKGRLQALIDFSRNKLNSVPLVDMKPRSPTS